MSFLKTIGDKITKAEKGIEKAKKKYKELKKEAKPITSAATRTFDYILPPMKKKKGKTTKQKMCPCKKSSKRR